MGFPLYLLVSGDVLYLGLLFVVAGVSVATPRPTLGSALAWSGLALALVSALPFHPAAYAILLVAGVGWQVSRTRNATLKRSMGGVLFVIMAALVVAAAADRRGPSLTPRADRPVFVIGDSLSAGVGASKEGTWPQLLSVKLNLPVENLAQAGATLADGHVQARAIPGGPSTVLVELGGNDVLGGSSPATFRADLRALLGVLVAKDRRVLMFELPLLPFQNAFGRIQREACRNYGVDLLPRHLLAGAIALPGHAGDGLHLTSQGHSWLAGRVAQLWGDS